MNPGRELLVRRVGAYLTDVVLLFAFLAPAGWLAQQALGVAPATGPGVWMALVLNFSLPAWLYFTVADASPGGATFGKRWLGIRVEGPVAGRVEPGRALLRTAVKLLPWELTHVFGFGLAHELGRITAVQGSGLAVANLLGLVYLLSAALTGGRRAVHDHVAGTEVAPAAASSIVHPSS